MYSLDKSHAPRERVSWNCQRNLQFHQRPVTLHVSVWVEMILITALGLFFCGHAPRERVSWNPMNVPIRDSTAVTLHVSVWVEIIDKNHSTNLVNRHAPRERVSWNCCLDWDRTAPSVSRSTWACELKCRTYSQNKKTFQSRSTWACELKSRYSN